MNPIEIGQLVGQLLTFLASGVAIVVAVVNKKARTPADDQARAEFAYKVLKERYEEAVEQIKVLNETANYMREQGREDFEREQRREQLIRDLNRQIAKLTDRLDEYERRMNRLANKVRNGEAINLEDIYGEGFSGVDNMEELEQTFITSSDG